MLCPLSGLQPEHRISRPLVRLRRRAVGSPGVSRPPGEPTAHYNCAPEQRRANREVGDSCASVRAGLPARIEK